MTRLSMMAIAVGLICAQPGTVLSQGETLDRLQPDFTFRRVTVPTGTTGSRITVQIDPTAPSALGSPRPATARNTVDLSDLGVVVPSPSGYEWFWDTISPRLADSGPGRLEQAVRALEGAPAGTSAPIPRIQALQDIASVHGIDILRATIGTKVSPALVLAVIAVESTGGEQAVSSAGAVGLMQLMPATAERFGVADRLVSAENIRGGVAYLDWLLGHFDGDPVLALAGYNAGEGSVRDNGGVPPYAETRAYVPKVLAAWTVARGLCQTPPVLISDGCVFAVNNL